MVVLRCDEHVAVERTDGLGPALRVLVGVLTHRRRHGLVEQRQVERCDVEELEGGVVAGGGDLLHPVRDGLTVASGAGASDDDGDPGHAAPEPCPRRSTIG